MIKAIILSFVGITYSFEITITKEFIYQEMTTFWEEDRVEKRYFIYDLKTLKTHVIENDLKSRTILDTKNYKDSWSVEGKYIVSQKIKSDEMTTYHGLECVLFEELMGLNTPMFSGSDGPIESVIESYHCNLKPLAAYLDLQEDVFKVLPIYKNLVDSHPFEIARWTNAEIGGKYFISPPLEKIQYMEIEDVSFIEQLMAIPVK